MRNYLFLGAGTALLASCAPAVTVSVAAPRISNVQNQRTYCVGRATVIDFGLSYSGNVDRIDVYAVPSGTPLDTRTARPVGGTNDVFTFGRGRVSGQIVFQPRGANLSGTTVQVAPSRPNVAQALSIVVNPVNAYDLYYRAFSVTGSPSQFVRGQSIIPDDTANCDPDLTY